MTEPSPTNTKPPANSGFDLNQPTVIALLYLGGFATGISSLIGIVLAHMWAGDNQEEWANSHFAYLIRTFWFGLLGFIVSGVLTFVLIGILLFPMVAVWVGVRSVICLLKAQKREPMPDPKTLWI
ncbi:MAG: hypothetical protein AAFY07_13470 [Pseudomonadota bacterium]